jgi:hypothetical protein
MDEENTQETTLRDTIEAAFDEHVPDAAPVADAPVTDAAVPVADAPAADGRARGPDGKFVTKDSATAPAAATTQKATATAASPAAVADPVVQSAPPAITRPSSWKKERWADFDKLAAENPQVAQYILQREQEFASGVSTYKTEYERAKPLIEAYAPHADMFRQNGIDPGQQFSRYVEMHKALAFGNDDQKLGVLMQLAAAYKAPVEKMFIQKDGQLYFNPQFQQQAQAAPQQQQFNPQAIEAIVQKTVAKERTAAEIAAMESNTQQYPHFGVVRNTMAQLLDAGVAADLPSAYEAALALPQHRELQQAALAQAQAADEAARKAKATAEAARARQANVSPRTATPAAKNAPPAKRSLRSDIEAAFDEHVGASRV